MTTPTTSEKPAQAGPPTCHKPEWCGQPIKPHPSTRGFCSKACHDYYISTRESAPPIAPPTPAPARERRAEQRWRFDGERNGLGIHILTLIEMSGPDHWICETEGKKGRSAYHVEWWTDNNGEQMTLIADAPATSEPGRAEHPLVTEAKARWAERNGLAARPAQEAAKAEPTVVTRGIRCGNSGCTTPYRNVAQRWSPHFDGYGNRVSVDLEWSCEPCHLLDEDEFYEPTTHGEYKGPARLPRPRLAHSMGVEDPCLEDT